MRTIYKVYQQLSFSSVCKKAFSMSYFKALKNDNFGGRHSFWAPQLCMCPMSKIEIESQKHAQSSRWLRSHTWFPNNGTSTMLMWSLGISNRPTCYMRQARMLLSNATTLLEGTLLHNSRGPKVKSLSQIHSIVHMHSHRWCKAKLGTNNTFRLRLRLKFVHTN